MHEKTSEKIFDQVRSIITEIIEIDPNMIKMQSDLRGDLNVDSLASIEIVMALEDTFGIRINEEQANKLCTVSDLVFAIANTEPSTNLSTT